MEIKNLFIAKNSKPKPGIVLLNIILVSIVLIAIFSTAINSIGLNLNFSFIYDYRVRIFNGFSLTIKISLASLVLSLAIGIISAIGHSSKILFVRYLCSIYVQFIRGTPLIMQIYLFFYIVGTAWNINDRFIAGVLILSTFEGAYISEIIRGSLLSIEESQLESARAVGFTKWQTLRFVILPQLTARTLPALTGQFASIIKDSSLLSIISVIELAQTIKEITAVNYRMFESYIFLGILYLCLTIPINLISKWLERRFKYEN